MEKYLFFVDLKFLVMIDLKYKKYIQVLMVERMAIKNL